MFVEQSITRLWRVRTAYVLLCLVPTVGLVVWAASRFSATHRQSVARSASQLLGTEVTITGVTHPRPGCLHLSGVQLGGLFCESVGVEATAAEVRLQLDSLSCTPATVPLLVELCSRWLTEPTRFDRNCVLAIDRMEWKTTDGGADEAASSLRVECVAAGTGRALRIFRPGQTTDELRIVRTVVATDGGQPVKDQTTLEVNLTMPIPAEVVQVAWGERPTAAARRAAGATLQGRLYASGGGGRWTGEATGRLAAVDLARLTALLPSRVEGIADLDIAELVWAANRITACDLTCTAARGGVDQSWLDGLVSIMGCRAATAFRDPLNSGFRDFERLSCRVRIDAAGVQLQALPQRAGCLAESQGLPLVKEPAEPASLDRLAWLLSGTAPPAVPGTAVSAWLLSVLPFPGSSR